MASDGDNMPTAAKQRAVVVGGGPAGGLMAVYLARVRGFEVDVFEAFEEDRVAGPTIRSWNVVLSDRGMVALKAGGVDLEKEAGERVVVMTGCVRHHAQEKLSPSFTGTSSICRGDLAMTLLEKAAGMPNVNVHFGCALTGVDMDKRVATFERGNGDVIEEGYDMLVGADGVNSRVRKSLEENVPDFTVRQREDPMAFKTIEIPIMGMEEADESWKTRFHVINSEIGCIGAAPRSGGKLTAVVILPNSGKTSFGTLMKTTQDVRGFFGRHYPSAFGHEGPSVEVAKDFHERRTQQLRSTYCSRLAHGRIVLIGDAAHSMWASLGQGVNSALEDCRVLAQVLDSAAEGEAVAAQGIDVPGALEAFNEQRWEDATAACVLSERGMGGARSVRPMFAARLYLTGLLHKTLGRVAPEMFTPPSIMTVNLADKRYGDILRGVEREDAVASGLLFGTVALVVAGVAKRFMRRRNE